VTRILIIMPALNEEESLRATLKELREVVDGPDILVIDDGSTDATAEVASRAGALSAQLPFTLGVGGAVRVGLHYAQRNGYDRAVVIDADGQHDPAGITALLEALNHGADMAVGSRFAAGTDDYPVGRTRRQAMRFLGAIVRALTGQRFSDVTSGFRAFDRPVIELLAREYPVEYLADTVEALLLVRYAGFRVDEVPISMRPRAAGEPSTRRVKLAINYLRLLIGILGSASRRARLRKDEA
jgi:glycosyltransferase involved in cell wall biosynthesis